MLDDYHRIAPSPNVDELLRRIVARPPMPMRLVLVSRRDPPLGLTMLRAQGRLVEVRLQDLRFTAPETSALLERMLGSAPSEEAIANLQ